MAGHRIVVADDDLDTLELMDALLTQEGFQPILCSEAEDAYVIVRRTQPDLVILGLQMGSPETGWQILNLLRGDPTTTHIPALMYSAHSDFLRVRAGVLRTQRCATLEKPFALPDLLATIAEALALRGPA